MRSITFVALMYIMAMVGWLMGGGSLYEKVRFESDAASAVMTSVDPALARAFKYNPKDYAYANVVFDTGEDKVTVSKFAVRPRDLEALVAGKGVNLRFRRGNPHEVLYEYQEKPIGVGWWILALAGTALAIYAHRLLRRQTG